MSGTAGWRAGTPWWRRALYPLCKLIGHDQGSAHGRCCYRCWWEEEPGA